ncbi:hypothetical protein RHHCN13_04730 [Rickettsia conorii subsp. heilongjiangensis]|uniref:Uncharacterized protein n=1 Tax=Rickettsia conorii subsp. heilongjiangensis TaxID=226665 RepID=A0AAD1GJA3_RICCR|nr:hypothetical protein [Rickettsia conorii]AEK74921.1 hypothetical protein Rh054_05075 [Rickettsia conorii subsp. heilongjiangensis 054]BBM91661.1 hypothetical protein RHCH81_04730 [Rickettsia conorii subsp. heilongjiangensis]BBM92869.1 hypothetical protein RHHCN13_04730 [Rickettsia conorii subsp. heilongjiangensis]BBM94078.1 hypothetical protein RHSENDAI29_04730 [Rickettsia conorii subsp. heilongjiangensis]BBM95287.1 hypothetical protein RHSENDAI58_04730 [Rickettsia conorii subsp. heilongjia
MLSHPSNIDPQLLAQEVNTMMPLVEKDLADVEDTITYGKERLFKFVKDKKIMEALAFMYCFEGNTGQTLDIKELCTTNDLLYRDDFSALTETLDTLALLIGIFFSK